jgi:hypothetical protein
MQDLASAYTQQIARRIAAIPVLVMAVAAVVFAAVALRGTDSDRDEIRRLLQRIERCERRDSDYLEALDLRAELRDRVLGTTKVARSTE